MAKIIQVFKHEMKIEESGLRNPACMTLHWPAGKPFARDGYIDCEVITKKETKVFILTEEDYDHLMSQLDQDDKEGRQHFKDMKKRFLQNEKNYQFVAMEE